MQDITPPESVLQAMEKQMQAERNKRATILTSEGEKEKPVSYTHLDVYKRQDEACRISCQPSIRLFHYRT